MNKFNMTLIKLWKDGSSDTLGDLVMILFKLSVIDRDMISSISDVIDSIYFIVADYKKLSKGVLSGE